MKIINILPVILATALSQPTDFTDSSSSTSSNTTLLSTRSFPRPSDLIISFYSEIHCRGNMQMFDPIYYGENNQIVKGRRGNLHGGHSYYLSRGLLPGEQLDFSRKGVPHDDVLEANCAKYYKSAPGEQKQGCQPLGVKVSCFRLWSHPGH